MPNSVLAGGGERTVDNWRLHPLAPAMAENQIQLTADIKLSKAIATERNLSTRIKLCALRRPTKTYPTALVEAVVGN